MDELERKIRTRLRDDFIHYAEKCLKIRTKSGEIKPFLLNKAQRYIHDKIEHQKLATGKVRAIILKGRQQGCSTLIEGRFYWCVTHRFGVRAFILTHDNDATNNLFEMAQRYHEHCPTVVRPTIEASNAKELIFAGLDSGYKLGTAGNKSVGRSSTIQLLHGSEVSFWPNADQHAKGILQAVPSEKNTEVFIESTANGVGNYFHQQWQAAISGESEFIPIFVPWFWQEEYADYSENRLDLNEEENELIDLYQLNCNQLLWRRKKIKELSSDGRDGLKAFKQEYPCTPVEAFQMSGSDHFIPTEVVSAARKCKVEEYGPLLIGVDPARLGKDRTAIIRRRSRKVFGMEKHQSADGMEVAGIVHNIIVKENPVKVFIDVIGLGGPIYDRLKELGHENIVVPVNSNKHAFDRQRYGNKKTENWCLMRDWFFNIPCEIPDSDEFHSDICAPESKRPDSNGCAKIETKEDMLARGVRSPDFADALAMTFALPVTAFADNKKEKEDKQAKNIMSTFQHINKLKKAAYAGK